MSIILLALFLVIGAKLVINMPTDKYYHGKEREAEKEITKYTRIYRHGYTIMATIFTYCVLIQNVSLQLMLFEFGRRVPSVGTLILTFVMYYVYCKLFDILLEHGKVKAIEEHFRPQDSLHQLTQRDAEEYCLIMSPEFLAGTEEVIELFWSTNHNTPLKNPKSCIIGQIPQIPREY